MKKPSSSSLIIGLVAVIAFIVGMWLGFSGPEKSAPIVMQDTVITVLPRAKALKPFSLVTGTNKPFGIENLRGKYSLLFFGYTSCPDVCPTTLYELKKLYLNLDRKKQTNFQVVFISVDPGRDTPSKMQKYVSYFHKDFIGLTGDKAEIANIAHQFGASYEVEDTGKSKNYNVSHTGVVFVTNPDARFAAILTPPHNADRIESRLDLLMQLEKQGSNR